MAKKAIVLLAEGFEEVEAITPIDYLRRAGIEVTVAAVKSSPAVKGSHGIMVSADATLQDVRREASAVLWDALVLPGGMPGAANLAASKEVGALICEMAAKGKLICAICASPAVVLAPLDILSGKTFTCYPGMEANVQGGMWTEDRVAIDGNLITSRGAGTAGHFAVAIIGQLVSKAEADKLAKSVLL